MSRREQPRLRRSSRQVKRIIEEDEDDDEDDDDEVKVILRSRSKRLRELNQKREEEGKNSDPIVEEDRSFTWIDSGIAYGKQRQHESLRMVLNGKTTLVTIGDTVLLASDANGSDEAFVAKVERLWQAPTSAKDPIEYGMKMKVRWFFKKSDIKALEGQLVGPISKRQLLQKMTDRDLILSDQYDENDVLSLLGKCTVVNRQPEESCKATASRWLSNNSNLVWVSRYSIDFMDGTPVLMPYVGENEPWPEEEDKAAVIESDDSQAASEKEMLAEELAEELADESESVKSLTNEEAELDDSPIKSEEAELDDSPTKSEKGEANILLSTPRSEKCNDDNGNIAVQEKEETPIPEKERRKSTTKKTEEEVDQPKQRSEKRKSSVILMRTRPEDFIAEDTQQSQDTSYLDDAAEDEDNASDEDEEEGSDTQFSFGAKWLASQGNPI